jgi:hypothetical protein
MVALLGAYRRRSVEETNYAEELDVLVYGAVSATQSLAAPPPRVESYEDPGHAKAAIARRKFLAHGILDGIEDRNVGRDSPLLRT